MATRARKRRRRRDSGSSGWLLVAALLAFALAAGGFFWWQERQPSPAAGPPAAPVARRANAARPKPAPAPPVAEPERFEFYDLLPDQEVKVPAKGGTPAAGTPPPPLRAPGIYVVQAGSFPNFAEADAVKARLALLGIESQIQTITVDGRTFHRVRVGPIEDPAALNRIRSRLSANKLEYLVVQVTE